MDQIRFFALCKFCRAKSFHIINDLILHYALLYLQFIASSPQPKCQIFTSIRPLFIYPLVVRIFVYTFTNALWQAQSKPRRRTIAQQPSTIDNHTEFPIEPTRRTQNARRAKYRHTFHIVEGISPNCSLIMKNDEKRARGSPTPICAWIFAQHLAHNLQYL